MSGARKESAFKLAGEACEKVELAHAYWSDGAPRAAARVLREAADLFDQVGTLREAAMLSEGETS